MRNGRSPLWQLYQSVGVNPEHDLFDSVINEYTRVAGFPVLYYVYDEDNGVVDPLYGEDTARTFLDPKETMLSYEPTEELTILDAFGITSDETIQFAFMPKSIFTEDVNTSAAPKAGDVIKSLWNNRNYAVVDVGAEANIFQGKKLIWEFILKPYRYSMESDESEDILLDVLQEKWEDGLDETTLNQAPSAFGQNDYIEEESDDIDNYSGADTTIYGF